MDITKRDQGACVYSFIPFFLSASLAHMQACSTQPSVRDKIMTGDGRREESCCERRCKKNTGVSV